MVVGANASRYIARCDVPFQHARGLNVAQVVGHMLTDYVAQAFQLIALLTDHVGLMVGNMLTDNVA
jgi:hypothetical protein